MKKRVVLQAMGEVQKVGYRDFVLKAARKLGVVGYVENMRDGSVKIVCEGEEATTEEFKQAIKVKFKFIDVHDIKTVETAKPTGEFQYFDIKRGDSTEELGERLDVSILYLDATRDELKGEMKSGFSDLKNEMKSGFNKVEGAISSMHTDVNTRFDTLDNKYGEISKKMNDLTTELQKSTNALVAMTEKVGALIDKKLSE
ncbi:MAG: acylphosphatase [Methanobacteriota archaeon]